MKKEIFKESVFQNPTEEFRGAPFWSWNGKVEKEVLKEQIDVLKKMGFGGFHIHSRIGMDTEYLGREFMEYVKFCNEYGKSQGMQTWLYDEDKWPSGYGGGFVTENPEFRARYLLFSPNHYDNGYLDRRMSARSRLTENGDITLLQRYEIIISKEGYLEKYHHLNQEEPENENTWYAYEVIGEKLPWFNNAAYVDTLNPNAIRKFLDVTYRKYAECLGNEFSKSIPAIFTDEPQFTKMQNLTDGRQKADAGIAYTIGFDAAFYETYGYHFWDKLPEIFWRRADGEYSEMKYHYHNLISQRFADSYAGILGKWCGENNIRLTGHLMYEDTLERQTQCVGDAMRSYIYFQQPGIDILAGKEEYATAKQAQSVVRQQGAAGMTSELYGVTNWDYDFRGHKLQGDWQAALGVTTRVPHLAWMYMGGESKRDYPAPIDAHSPWYQKYPLIEDHFARINTVLCRGKAKVRVAVLHPIESYWLLYASDRQTLPERKQMDEDFQTLIKWLLFGQIDFDFISEGLLPKQKVSVSDGLLRIGEMSYEILIIPKILTIRRKTLELIDEFQKGGGKVFLLGDIPEYHDGKKEKPSNILKQSLKIPFEKETLLRFLKPYRDIEIFCKNGIRKDTLIYQMREENGVKWLFIAHGKEENEIEDDPFMQTDTKEIEIHVRGKYEATFMDTMTGKICPADYVIDQDFTVIFCKCYAQDSFLFKLEETEKKVAGVSAIQKELLCECYLPSVNPYMLEEANVLLLDNAFYSLDGGILQNSEEILRIDNEIRKTCNYRLRTDSFPQPWLSHGENKKEHEVYFKFLIDSEVEKEQVELAFEGERDVEIFWNQDKIIWEPKAYFVDRKINRLVLGKLKKGENLLELKIPFGEKTNLEWCYLLGDFGVRVMGSKCRIVSREKEIGFGDYSMQGFPFYGGNFVYEIPVETPNGEIELEIPNYRASLLEVSIDDGEKKPVFMDPCKVNLGKIHEGFHKIRIISYGNRSNQFAQLHNCNKAERYFGPLTWRTSGKNWCYEYQLKQSGVLTSPIMRIYK